MQSRQVSQWTISDDMLPLTLIDSTSKFVVSQEGAKVQKQLWHELSVILERVQPGIMKTV
jgi:hypothetical protein